MVGLKKRKLTYESLNGEYLNWALKYGEERNEDDLRFGQYITNKYDMLYFTVDVFNIEDYEETYSELLRDLYERAEE